ncbi:MAG TPA: glycoside hydrolase family 13 protein [Pseudolysinimonas sp.]|nr:glycoside hydrolase family 13 protein [Pseudolysinimonas sp.]
MTSTSPVPSPAWVRDAVFYQIFPDRFANGDPSIDPEGVEAWGRRPTRGNFFGGDLAGIESRLDHIESLGANALYLTPIFEADTNHRYDTADYFRIDHRLGDLNAFRRLIAAAHARGIRVVLDAVFNHAGEGHWAFRHVYAHGADSPYASWFTVDAFPVVREPEPNYATCMGCKYLPQINHADPAARAYLLEVARHWAREGIDGWRLDVPFLVEHDFWREFRREVKGIDDDLYIVAEIWGTAEEWLQGDMADGAMNYPLRDLICDFADGGDHAERTASRLASLHAITPERSRGSMLNLLGSHDTPRIATRLAGEPAAIRIAVALLLTSPGAPMIYYGDEVGLEGGEDPDCRRTMPWSEHDWNAPLLDWHRRLIALRRAHPALRGDVDAVTAHGSDLLVRKRSDGRETLWVVANRGRTPIAVSADAVAGATYDLLAESRLAIREGELLVPPGVAILGSP